MRHKSIESLAAEMEDRNPAGGKGDRSNWPAIARNGKWNSMEQMHKKNEFAGVRSKSLPASRCQSSESLDFQSGAGLNELSEKLNALKTSQERILSETDNPESDEPCFDDKNEEKDPESSESDHGEGKENEGTLEDYPEESISKHVENKVQRSPSKSTNTEKTELVSSAVQVNLSSGRSTPHDSKPEKKRSGSRKEQKRDKKNEKVSPREKKQTSRSSNETKRPEGLTSRGIVPKDGLSRDGSKERPKVDKEDSSISTKSKENYSKVSNRGESPYHSTSARPYSQNTSSSSLPQDSMLNKSPYASPRTTAGPKKDSFNRGRSELLSLIAGERPGQDLTTVQNLRLEVEDKNKPKNLDLDRSITYDIFAPLNKSCPIFTTKEMASNAQHCEGDPALNTSRTNWTQLHKMNPYGGALVNRVRVSMTSNKTKLHNQNL